MPEQYVEIEVVSVKATTDRAALLVVADHGEQWVPLSMIEEDDDHQINEDFAGKLYVTKRFAEEEGIPSTGDSHWLW